MHSALAAGAVASKRFIARASFSSSDESAYATDIVGKTEFRMSAFKAEYISNILVFEDRSGSGAT